jgi:ribulose 1,5-bisphosphate synthetase/thiazole synthase
VRYDVARFGRDVARAKAGRQHSAMIDATADIVVAGGGHNSLIAACYLAKAG